MSFDFDVANKMYYPLSEGVVEDQAGQAIDPWFFACHSKHDLVDERAVLSPRPSLLSSASRVSVPVPGTIPDFESQVENVESAAAKVKTAPAKNAPAPKKRPLSEVANLSGTSTSGASSNSSSTHQHIKRMKPSSSVPPSIARPPAQLTTGVVPCRVASATSAKTKPTTMIAPSKKSVGEKVSKGPTTRKSRSDVDDEIKVMLREHNTKHAPKPTYVPAMYGVRDVRTWEMATGLRWQDLSPGSKVKANVEIGLTLSRK